MGSARKPAGRELGSQGLSRVDLPQSVAMGLARFLGMERAVVPSAFTLPVCLRS